jgi:prevent-host-death family protein
MTMRKRHWSVAEAKASLSRVLHDAEHAPQVIEKRGEVVAVVVSIDAYRRALGDPDQQRAEGAPWREFLAKSAELRAGGGFDLALPGREERLDPFSSMRAKRVRT